MMGRFQDRSPSVSPNPECQLFSRSCDCLVPGHHHVALLVTELREAKAVELLGVWVYLFIGMNRIHRERHVRIRGDGHAVRKREGT